MDRVSLLRFLLAVLLWCRDGVSEEDRVNLAGMTEGVPDQWLEKLDEYKAKFNLLGEGERFFQERHVRHAAA